MPPSPWRLLKTVREFDCPYFEVRADQVSHHGGQPRPYNHFRMKYFGVYVVPIDAEGCTTLVGQHRYVLDRFTWEVPAGGARVGIPWIESAKAELSEETGFRADHWLEIVSASISPGMTDEMSTGFVAWGLHAGKPHPDQEETLWQKRVQFDQAIAMALDGAISNMASIALVLGIHARLLRGELPADLAALLKGPPRKKRVAKGAAAVRRGRKHFGVKN